MDGTLRFTSACFPRCTGRFFHCDQHPVQTAEYQPITIFIHNLGLLAIFVRPALTGCEHRTKSNRTASTSVKRC
ncbi:hypothetical protein BLAT2472_20331 [Burkholderia latens]